MTERMTPWKALWCAVDPDVRGTRWTASIASITAVSCCCGYTWHSSCLWVTFRERADALRAEGIWIHYGGPGVGCEWLVLTLACVLYGALGWRRLGAVLVCLQIATLLPLCTTYLDYTPDSVSRNPFHSWPGAAQGGCIAGVLAVVGIAWFHRHTPSQPQTVRAMFAAIAFAAVMLGALKLWVEWKYAPYLATYREFGPW